MGTSAEVVDARGGECDPVPLGNGLPMENVAERVPQSQQRLSSFSALEPGRGVGTDQYRVARTRAGAGGSPSATERRFRRQSKCENDRGGRRTGLRWGQTGQR